LSPRRHRLQAPRRIGKLLIIPGPFFPSWALYRACSIVIEDGERAIVDPGSSAEALEPVAEQGVAVNINTHHHGDHMLFNPLFAGAELWLSEPEAETYGDLDLIAEEYGADRKLAELWKLRIDPRERAAFALPVSRTVADGERVSIGDTEIVFHLLPGHARGMLGLEFPRERLVYTADVDLTMFGPWYGQRSSSIDAFIDSARAIAELDADHFLTGHEEGLLTADEFRERLPGYLGIIDRRDERLLSWLDEPRRPAELIGRGMVYPPKSIRENPWVLHWEMMHLKAHLARLALRGAVLEDDGGRFCRS